MPRGRTRLTTPPGEEPAPAAGDGSPEDAHYLPALDIPTEPRHPSRFRWLYVTVAGVVLVAAVAVAVLQLTSASRTFDPSLQFPGQEPASPVATPGS